MRGVYTIATSIVSRIFDVLVEAGEKSWEARKDRGPRETYL